MKKKCELCNSLAWMHCESDQANLCWTCDHKVHAANFLVARHSRTLLCRFCQSPTPWKAAGADFCRAVSLCDACARSRDGGSEDEALRGNECEDSDAEFDSDESSDGGIETSDDEEEGNELEGEHVEVDDEDNQVVPWSPTSPPPASPSSNSDGESYSSSPSSPIDRRIRALQIVSDLPNNGVNSHLSPFRGNATSPLEAVTAGESRGVVCGDGRCERNLKRRGFDPSRVGLLGTNSLAVVDSVKRVRREEMRSSALGRLSEEDSSAVDSDFSGAS